MKTMRNKIITRTYFDQNASDRVNMYQKLITKPANDQKLLRASENISEEICGE